MLKYSKNVNEMVNNMVNNKMVKLGLKVTGMKSGTLTYYARAAAKELREMESFGGGICPTLENLHY